MTEQPGQAFLGNCLLFTRALRQAGLPIGLDQALAFAQALEWIDLGSRDEVYHTARSLLVSHYEHLRLFDAIFNRFWRPLTRTARRRQMMPRAPRHKPHAQPFTIERRTLKQRPLVMIADISGSMEKYARLLLQFLYSVTHSLPRVECFVFGTRLTRITAQLKVRNIDQAIDQAAHEVIDWAGGTRIGASLQGFNRHWGRRVLGRGAVVLLISDGWEQGDPELLATEVRRLQRRCYRLIWLNPLLGRETYQPRVGGIRAVLSHIDDFLPIHNFQSLETLAQRLGALSERRSR